MKVFGFYVDGHLMVYDISTQEKELSLLADICKEALTQKWHKDCKEDLDKLLLARDTEGLWEYFDKKDILRTGYRGGPSIAHLQSKWETGNLGDL